MVPPAAANVAELTKGAQRAEKDDFVFSVVIALNEVSLPAASLGVRLAAALHTHKLGAGHGQDHAASRRGRKVARTDSRLPQVGASSSAGWRFAITHLRVRVGACFALQMEGGMRRRHGVHAAARPFMPSAAVQNAGHRHAFRLRDPQVVLGLDRDLPRDIPAVEGGVRRQPGGSVLVALRTVRRAIDREQH
jgi:hypothetical protein